MTESITFDVRGLAIPQGSTRAFIPKGWDHAVITSSAKGLKQWRRLIADVAQRYAPPRPWGGPIRVELGFRIPKPKSEKATRCDIVHPHKGAHHIVPVRTWPDKRPDIDKLARSVLDALTHIFFDDDSQVVILHAEKDYGPAGVHILVATAEDPPGVQGWPKNEAERALDKFMGG